MAASPFLDLGFSVTRTKSPILRDFSLEHPHEEVWSIKISSSFHIEGLV